MSNALEKSKMRSKNFQLELATLGPGESSFHKGGTLSILWQWQISYKLLFKGESHIDFSQSLAPYLCNYLWIKGTHFVHINISFFVW